jgi:hypothetical protein
LDHTYSSPHLLKHPASLPVQSSPPKPSSLASTSCLNTVLSAGLAEANRMIKESVRESTLKKYSLAYARWTNFCSLTGVSPLPASAAHVSACLATLASETRSVSTVEAVYAAISHAHHCLNLKSPTSGPAVSLLMRSIRRRFKKPVSSVKPLTSEMLRAMLDHLYQPSHGHDGLDAPLVLWRTTWRITLAYYLFARFDDMARLKRCDLEFAELPHLHLKVCLRGGKTDTSNQGFIRFVSGNFQNPLYCPVRLTRLYLTRIGSTHQGFLVARTQTSTNRQLIIDGQHRLAYSRARSDFRQLLSTLGFNPDDFCEHSPKRGAVTDSSNAGLDNDTLQDIVGWKSHLMPKIYNDRSTQHYLSCSAKLHLH